MSVQRITVRLRYDSASRGWQFVQQIPGGYRRVSQPYDGGSVFSALQSLLEKNGAIKKTLVVQYESRSKTRKQP